VFRPETDIDKGDQIGGVNKSENPQFSISVFVIEFPPNYK